jgi:hypothetical protein
MTQTLYAHMNKRNKKKIKVVPVVSHPLGDGGGAGVASWEEQV